MLSEPIIDSGLVGFGPTKADFRNGHCSKSFTTQTSSANRIVQLGRSNQHAPKTTRTATTPRHGSWQNL